MKVLPRINTTPVLLVFSLVCGLTISRASAEPMHTPTKMPIAKAESVGMSTDGLSRIDEVMQEHIDAGHIQGAVTIVARRGKVVHFSTHGQMDVKKGHAMEPDAIFRMASSTKPVLGVAAMMMIEEGLISPSDPVSKYIPEFADLKVAVLAEPADRDVSPAWVNPKGDVSDIPSPSLWIRMRQRITAGKVPSDGEARLARYPGRIPKTSWLP